MLLKLKWAHYPVTYTEKLSTNGMRMTIFSTTKLILSSKVLGEDGMNLSDIRKGLRLGREARTF